MQTFQWYMRNESSGKEVKVNLNCLYHNANDTISMTMASLFPFNSMTQAKTFTTTLTHNKYYSGHFFIYFLHGPCYVYTEAHQN